MAMNRSGTYLDETFAYYRRSGTPTMPRSIHAPVLSILTWLSLLAYLISLAITQTAYGWPFMTIRWVTLGALTAFGAADWILLGAHSGHRAISNSGHILIVYLLLTLSSVVYAENWIFSGMRWTSHAAMLVVLVLLIPQIITLAQIRVLLSVLKYIMASLVVFSWIFPSVNNAQFQRSLYRGAMGNANTMGHIAFIASLLFLQDFFVTRIRHRRYLCGAFALAAMVTVWRSGARSSMMAMILGILLLLYYYRKETHGIAIIGILLGSLAMVALPKLPQEIARFANKSDGYTISVQLNPLKSRVPTWSAAWEGFKARPLLGWGFGADNTISKQWKVQLTALGATERDPVNDFCYIMEGCGIVGFLAYFFLIYVVVKQGPTRLQRRLLRNFGSDKDPGSGAMALHHTHIALYILPVCLLALNQLDNSALSAGNLISVTLWLGTGCAATLRHEMEQRQRY
jgi:O-antigen ligase